MIVFHHIPKTGGLAILENIARCNPGMSLVKWDAPFQSEKSAGAPSCDLLHGHFAYDQIPQGAVRFTFARHPIARFSSCFYSLRQELHRHGITRATGVRALGFAGGIRLSFREEDTWFLDRIEDFTDEFLRTRGTFGLDLIPEVFTPDYDRYYDFIGITERMASSIEKLGAIVKTDPSAVIVCNQSNSGMIRYRLGDLQKFYGEAIETYRALCET